MSFIAGPYAITYNSNSIGIVEDAVNVEITNVGDEVRGDNLGLQDGVYRGGTCYIDMVLQEFNAAGAAAAFWPFGTFGTVGTVGGLFSSLAAPLALSSSVAAPNAITFTYAVLAPNYPIRLLYGSRLRNVPLRLVALPYVGGTPSVARWFE